MPEGVRAMGRGRHRASASEAAPAGRHVRGQPRSDATRHGERQDRGPRLSGRPAPTGSERQQSNTAAALRSAVTTELATSTSASPGFGPIVLPQRPQFPVELLYYRRPLTLAQLARASRAVKQYIAWREPLLEHIVAAFRTRCRQLYENAAQSFRGFDLSLYTCPYYECGGTVFFLTAADLNEHLRTEHNVYDLAVGPLHRGDGLTAFRSVAFMAAHLRHLVTMSRDAHVEFTGELFSTELSLPRVQAFTEALHARGFPAGPANPCDILDFLVRSGSQPLKELLQPHVVQTSRCSGCGFVSVGVPRHRDGTPRNVPAHGTVAFATAPAYGALAFAALQRTHVGDELPEVGDMMLTFCEGLDANATCSACQRGSIFTALEVVPASYVVLEGHHRHASDAMERACTADPFAFRWGQFRLEVMGVILRVPFDEPDPPRSSSVSSTASESSMASAISHDLSSLEENGLHSSNEQRTIAAAELRTATAAPAERRPGYFRYATSGTSHNVPDDAVVEATLCRVVGDRTVRRRGKSQRWKDESVTPFMTTLVAGVRGADDVILRDRVRA